MTEPLHVLIVEDSPTDLKLVVQALRGTGRPIEFERVETAAAMRAALERKPWDVVISDWSMPSFSALAALDLLEKLEIDLPFIIVSGTIGEEVAVDAMRAGAHDYVLKDKLARLAPAVEREVRESKIREGRRSSNKALLASEARYRRIVETTNQGVWMIDLEGRTTFMNARLASMLGYDRDEVVGMPVLNFVAAEWHDAAFRDKERIRKGAVQVEARLKRKDGSAFWVLLETAPTLGESGIHEGSCAMVMDVTERKKSEEALRLSEGRLRRLWDSGLILITISDTTGTIRDINEAGASMLGYSRAELLSGIVNWSDVTPPEWRAVDEAARAQLSSRGVASPWEKELIRKDGSRVSILAAAASLEGSEGIAIAVDMTEKKRAQTDLLERVRIEALTAEVALALAQRDSLPDILRRCAEAMVTHLGAALARIWILNAREQVLELQASAGTETDIDGPAGRVPVGRSKIGLIAEEQQPHFTNDLPNDSRAGDPEWARREGLVSFAGHPLLVAGQLVGVVAVFARHPLSGAALKELGALADVIAVGVQRKVGEEASLSLEAQLRQAQKMEAVGLLAGGIAHDFNNMLSVILSYAELMLDDLKSGDPLRDEVTEIHKAGVRAADLTRQLLMFSRQQIVAPKVLNLNDVVSGMDKMLQRLVGEDVALTSIPGASVGRVRVDPGSIEQVIMNLVVNARDAMPTGGKLTMETANVVLDEEYARNHLGAKPGAYVMLSVTDSGTGMDKATLARIFEPFFTTKETGKGTGLGLSTVFGIAQQSGGSVWVYSEPGIGTTFKVYLPRVDAAADVSLQRGPTSLRGSETILLVEDEEQVRNATRGILRRHGYAVVEARNAGEALLLCEQHVGPIHLLLSDVVMPGMSGPALAKRLVEARPEMKVLCMSGYTDDAAVRHGVIDAAFAYLQKPITVERLTRKVREVLDSERSGG